MHLTPSMAAALRCLASMPFMDRLQLAAVTGWSRGAAYDAVGRMRDGGLLAALPHAAPLTPATERFALTAAGVRQLARLTGIGVDRLLEACPVSEQWRRLLLERLDGVAVMYQVAAALADAAYPVRFRWRRALPVDAVVQLPGGRTLGILRHGATAGRTGFAKRLRRLRSQPVPGALLVIVPDEVRLRHVRRLLPPLAVPAFLALERHAATAGADDPVWRPVAAPRAVSLRAALDQVRDAGEVPGEAPLGHADLPTALVLPAAPADVPPWVLTAALTAAEKQALNHIADWPWIGRRDLAALLDVTPGRVSQLVRRLEQLGLVSGLRRGAYVLMDRGLGYMARRDRTAVGTARRRWSVAPKDAGGSADWRDVSGRLARQLRRNQPHTDGVHGFVAAFARQAGALGLRLEQLDPPHRAARFFREEGAVHSVRPDAFGVLRTPGGPRPFFLEWERRAVRPGTMAARLAPYLRYYATRRPLDDHGAVPSILVVLPDEIAVTTCLRVAASEMARTGIPLPLHVASEDALRRTGPLGPGWRAVGALADRRNGHHRVAQPTPQASPTDAPL